MEINVIFCRLIVLNLLCSIVKGDIVMEGFPDIQGSGKEQRTEELTV